MRWWDLRDGSQRVLGPGTPSNFVLAPDHGQLYYRTGRSTWEVGDLQQVDLTSGETTATGFRAVPGGFFALDSTGSLLAAWGKDGVVQVGPVTGERSHLLLSGKKSFAFLEFSPDDRWLAAGNLDGSVLLWPVPRGRPFHSRPREELLEGLRAVTNLRVVEDEGSDTGYAIETGPFPGWRTVPAWWRDDGVTEADSHAIGSGGS